jgi:hypothetical protein
MLTNVSSPAEAAVVRFKPLMNGENDGQFDHLFV